MLCVDVSGSMWGQSLTAFPSLTTHEAAAAMALVIADVGAELDARDVRHE